jgi:hypothetical protein
MTVWSQDSVVDIAIRLRAEWSGVRIPSRTIDISLLLATQTSFESHPAAIQWVTGSLSGDKAVGA